MDSYKTQRETVQALASMGHNVGCVVRFVMLFHNFMAVNQDYGIEEKVSVTELTTLIDIIENERITAAELTRKWKKTKGAVSQVLKKLEGKQLIRRERNEKNGKQFYIYPTDKGRQVVETYYSVDTEESPYILNELLKSFSPEEIHNFYSVMEKYSEILSGIL